MNFDPSSSQVFFLMALLKVPVLYAIAGEKVPAIEDEIGGTMLHLTTVGTFVNPLNATYPYIEEVTTLTGMAPLSDQVLLFSGLDALGLLIFLAFALVFAEITIPAAVEGHDARNITPADYTVQ